MSVKEVLRMGHPFLRKVAQPVKEPLSAEIQALIVDLRDTMQARNGAGLAAPQIGSPWRVVIYGTGSPNPRYPEAPIIRETVLINPVVEQIGTDTQTGWEGCLSVPGLRGEVTRWQRVDVRAMDQKGLMIQRRLDGFEARVVQDVQRSTLWTVNPRDQLNLGLMHVQRAAQGQRRRDICGWIGCVR